METHDVSTHSTANQSVTDQIREIIRHVIASVSNNSIAFALSTSQSTNSKDWIINSSAFNYITFDSSIFESSIPIYCSPSILIVII